VSCWRPFANELKARTSHGSGQTRDYQQRGQAMIMMCGSVVRAKLCGSANIHCAPGPARVQANEQIQACVSNGGKLSP
jgi:hypothetical protein